MWRAGWNWPERPFRDLTRPAAIAIAALLALCVAASAMIASPPAPRAAPAAQAPGPLVRVGDTALYRRLAERVARGEDYYHAAAEEHRRAHYPLRPFVAVRQPTLARIHAAIGPGGVALTTGLLVAANVIAIALALGRGRERIAVGTLVLLGSVSLVDPYFRLLHEFWAGLLLSLALAVYRPQRWWPSLALVAAALAVRELAAAFALLWLAFAALGHRWREVAGLAAVLAGFAALYALHAGAVLAVTRPGDLVSPGWTALGGPAPFFRGIEQVSVLTMLPRWVGGPVAVLALFGFVARGGRAGWFAATWIAGIGCGMAAFARPDNAYWAALVVPLLFAGLALVPRGLLDLSRTRRSPRASAA